MKLHILIFTFSNKFLQSPLLQVHVIVIVHIVDTDDRSPFQVVLQPFHQVATDESRSPCHQDGLTIQFNLLHKRTYQLMFIIFMID